MSAESTYPSRTISALAGTSKSIVLHFTILIPFFRAIPAKRYLSNPSGTGATAEKTMRRKKPIYLTTIVGKPILEDAYIGKVIERSFLPLIRMFQPEVVDFAMPAAGWFQGFAIVSIKKRYPGQAKKVMMGLWGLGQLALTKIFVVVDDDVNVHDINDVIWAITTRADAARDTIIINNTPTDTLDPASPLVNLGSKLGIDATQKTKEEGYQREIQEQVKVDEKTKDLVDAKWSQYGL